MGSIKIEEYGIYLAEPSPMLGAEMSKVRPVVVVSLQQMNDALKTVVVCPLTTKVHPLWRSRIQVECQGRMAEIAVDRIRVVSKERLLKRVDRLRDSVAEELQRIIRELYAS